MAGALDDDNTSAQLKSLVSVELVLLTEFGILLAFSGAALLYLRYNQSVAFKGDANAARKIILPSFEPLLWIISGVAGSLFGFFMLSLMIGLYEKELPPVPHEISYAGRQFIFLVVLVFFRQKSVSVPALRRSLGISLVLSAYTIPIAWYTNSSTATPWSLRGARLAILLFYGYVALFPTSRASRRTLREYCGFAFVFQVLLLTTNLFEDADNKPAVLVFQCVSMIWSSLCLFVLWRVLRADTEYWRGMGQRACDAQMAVIRNRHKTMGNRHFHERISSQGLHVLIEMHRKYIIDFAYLKIKQKIGVGSSAEVFCGILHSRTAVAVKVYTPVDFTDETVADFSHEAALCGALLHPNIVTFYGMCISPPTICLVSELCQGSLEDVTCANARRSHQPSKQFLLNLTLMLDAARAVAYLHSFSPAFLHRDIKPSNFLVDTDFNVKLTDFGESRSVQQGSNPGLPGARKMPREISSESTRASGDAVSLRMTVRGTVDYMAPELITGKAGLALYGEAADVYALGMTMWDILYPGREKYPELKNSHLLVFEAVLQGKRPRFYTKPNDQLRQIIEDTWHADARLRPSAENIVNVLETIQEETLASFSSELMEHLGDHFIGGSAVHRMQELKFVSTPGEAIRLGNALMDAGFVHHHKHKKPFENSSQCRYYIDESNIILCHPLDKEINQQGWIHSEVAPPPTNKRDGRKFSNVAESLAAHWMPRTSTESETQSLGPSERGRIPSGDQSTWSDFAGGQLCACRRLGQRLEQHTKRPRRGLRQKVRARLEENQLTANLLANENTLKGYEPAEPDVLLLEEDHQMPRSSSITIVHQEQCGSGNSNAAVDASERVGDYSQEALPQDALVANIMQQEFQSSGNKAHEKQRLNPVSTGIELKPIARLSPYDVPRQVRARRTDIAGDAFNLHESTKAISVEGVQSLEEMKVLRAIVAREQGLDRLLGCCCSFEKDRTVELLETMLQVRVLSLDTIDAIAGWRRRMIQIQPFRWRKVNYALKMACDLDFLSRSHQCIVAMDGIRLIKRNPFSTIGGLDQNMTMLWQYELPEEGDLSVLLDSASFVSSGVAMDVASRIRLAEWFIVLEERRYGKLSKAQIDSVDHRSKELIKREADFASKARFGLVQREDE